MKTIIKNPLQQSGFTLIELMVTVTIMGVLLAIAVPAMTSFLNSNRLTSHTGAIKQAIQYARSEAVSKNQMVAVCASNNGTSCTGTWNQGWIVFTDADGNGDGAVTGDDTVLRVWAGLSNNFTFANVPGTVVFNSDGTRESGAGNFVLRDPTNTAAAAHSRTLSVNNVGWVTVTKGG